MALNGDVLSLDGDNVPVYTPRVEDGQSALTVRRLCGSIQFVDLLFKLCAMEYSISHKHCIPLEEQMRGFILLEL